MSLIVHNHDADFHPATQWSSSLQTVVKTLLNAAYLAQWWQPPSQNRLLGVRASLSGGAVANVGETMDFSVPERFTDRLQRQTIGRYHYKSVSRQVPLLLQVCDLEHSILKQILWHLKGVVKALNAQVNNVGPHVGHIVWRDNVQI